MKFEQLAIYVEDAEAEIERWRRAGFMDWTVDEVLGTGWLKGFDKEISEAVEFQARLAFNYDIMPGTEVELIQPLTADHYISELSIEPHHIAHMGLHVDDEAHHQRVARLLGLWRQVFSIRTTDHLSPAVPENRRYQYDIYRSSLLPYPVKLIERCTV